MKKILLQLASASLALLAAPLAQAWSYQDGDVLLIFRESGFNDVEFDLGNVSQFLNKSNGYTVPVTGWNLNLVTNTFGSDLAGVSIILAATTTQTDANRAAWLSSGDPTALPYDLTPSAWQSSFWSIIDSLGARPVLYLVPISGANAYSIDPSGTYAIASYDDIVTSGGQNAAAIAQLGGHAAFQVEQIVPGRFLFWQLQPSTASPKPPATLIGTFTIDAGGDLTFSAGAPGPGILGITHQPGVSTVNFITTPGGNYWLAFTNTLPEGAAAWPTVGGPVVGDGNSHSLSHTNSDATGFYRVVRTP